MFKFVSIGLIVLSLGLAAPPARAAIKIYDDRDQFLTETGAEDAVGAYPDTGYIGQRGGAPSSKIFTGGWEALTVTSQRFVTSNATNLLPIGNPDGRELLVSYGLENESSENIDVGLAGARYAFGFDLVEPTGGVDSIFRVTLYRDATAVGSFTFAPEDDVASFVGVWSDEPFNRVEIRETTGTNDNEYYGHFYTGAYVPGDLGQLVFNQLAQLLANDGQEGDRFGWSVALDGNTAIIGARGDSDNGNKAGAAYVFVRQDTGWSQQAKLRADDGQEGDSFGTSVALNGDTALIGAEGNDNETGAVYVFVRQGTGWVQQDKLLAESGQPFDLFGWSVALDGDTALIGAIYADDHRGDDFGAAYVFMRQGTGWVQQDKLLAESGQPFDLFGWSVALDGDTALIGVPSEDDYATDSGAAFVFVRQGMGWRRQTKLKADDGQAGDRFGSSVALNGDTALIGVPNEDDNASDAGAAYVFVHQGTGWVQQDKLLANNGQADHSFGTSVALDGDTALIGAYRDDDNATRAGAAYVFVRQGTRWVQQDQLLADDGQAEDRFGYSVALDGNRALIGALGDDDNGNNAGAAYVFGEPPTDGVGSMPWIPLLLLDD